MSLLQTIRIANFSKLWTAQIVALIASYLLNFILIFTVYDLTSDTSYSTLSVSLVVLSFTVPAFFASPIAGAYVDYWNRKKVMVVVNILRAILVLCYIPAMDNLPLIIFLTLLISIITQFFIPAEAATIPQLVPKKYLVNANSLFVTSIYVTFIIGYIATIPTIALFGTIGAFYITAVLFLLAALLIAWLPKQSTSGQRGNHPTINPLTQLKINWQLVNQVPNRFIAVMMLGLSQGLMYILITLMPALSSTLFDGNTKTNSYLFIVPIGIGMVVGIIIVNLLPQWINILKTLFASLLFASVLLIFLGLYTLLWGVSASSGAQLSTTAVIVITVCLFGVFTALVATLAQTLLQYNTDDTNRGRVFGSLQMLISFGAILPIFITGFLSDTLGAGWALLIIGATLSCCTYFLKIKH